MVARFLVGQIGAAQVSVDVSRTPPKPSAEAGVEENVTGRGGFKWRRSILAIHPLTLDAGSPCRTDIVQRGAVTKRSNPRERFACIAVPRMDVIRLKRRNRSFGSPSVWSSAPVMTFLTDFPSAAPWSAIRAIV